MARPKKSRKPTDARIQIRTFPDGVNELIENYIEQYEIPHDQIEVIDEDAIVIHNPED